jgi:5,8-dihydroxy-2-naphthoate synthase
MPKEQFGGDFVYTRKQGKVAILTRELSLGYSTCPNDTLIFYGLVHGRVDRNGLDYKVTLSDVEELNRRAGQGALDITKLSFAAIGNLLKTYGLLRGGAALGKGCGPLLVAKPGVDLSMVNHLAIAIPGLWTTASMLLGLYAKAPPKLVPMLFSDIMPSIQNGLVDIGVIIHEGRFTYAEYGLTCLLDLGEWWEEKTGLPIPLGGIAIRRDLPKDIIQNVEQSLMDSIQYGLSHREEARPYITQHAQELASEVIDQHISLYVNDFSIDLGEDGVRAIDMLFRLAREKNMLPDSMVPLFASD